MRCSTPALVGCLLLGLVACDDSDSSGTVTIRMPKAPRAIVVYRDGDGPWTATTGAAGSVRFAAPSGTYTVVVGCAFDADEAGASVYAMTTAELSTIDHQGECADETQVISGQVGGVGGSAFVVWGARTVTLSTGASSSYTLEGPRGTGDLVVSLGSTVVITRDVSLGASPLTLDVNLASPSAVSFQQRRVTLSSVPESQTNAYGSLWTKNGTYASLCASSGAPACGLPATALVPGDFHMMRVETSAPGPYRAARWAVYEPTDREITSPVTQLGPAQVSLANQGARVAVSASWPDAPSAPLYRFYAWQYNTPPYRFWHIAASEGFIAGGGDLSFPDLTAVTGWDPGIELIAGAYVEWRVNAESGAPLAEMVRSFPTQESTVLEEGLTGFGTPQ
jgi:hypothetical protein